MKIFKFTHKQELIFWSYFGAMIAGEGYYFGGLFNQLVNGGHPHINWAIVGWVALSGIWAPIVRAINPRLKEFGLTKFANVIQKFLKRKASGAATP